MPNYILEGESYFVLSELEKIVSDKKININPEKVNSFSFLDTVDFYVFFDPDKETIEKINFDNFILCFMDKNLDLRLDYVKKIKQKSNHLTFDPIPTTDFISLKAIFPNIKTENLLPSKKANLKFKGSKQNYEWYDLCLINDLYDFDQQVYGLIFDSYFDIWKFTEELWSGDVNCLKQIKYINENNFEDYFNRIRETSKDYIEVIQTQSKNFYEHKSKFASTSVNNQFRYDKVKEKLNKINSSSHHLILSLTENCLKNVRLGSNPKLELIKLFFKFKQHVSR